MSTKEEDQEEGGTPDQPEIDYGRLSSPSGTSENDTDEDYTSDDDENDTDDNSENSEDQPDKGKAAGQEKSEESEGSSSFRENLQAKLRERYGADIEVPETITEDNYIEFVQQAALSNLHPEARRLQAAIEAGQNPEEFFRSYGNIEARLKMSDTDLMRMAYKEQYGKSEENPDGWDDDQLEVALKKSDDNGRLMIEAQEYRKQLRMNLAKRKEEGASYGQPKRKDFSDPKVQTEFKELVRKGVSPLLKEKTLYGLDIGKPEVRNQLTERVEYLLRPDPNTGISPTVKLLQSNDGLIRAAILLDMAEKGAISATVQRRVEQVKKKYLDELDVNPPKGSGGQARDGGIDLELLGSPAQVSYEK